MSLASSNDDDRTFARKSAHAVAVTHHPNSSIPDGGARRGSPGRKVELVLSGQAVTHSAPPSGGALITLDGRPLQGVWMEWWRELPGAKHEHEHHNTGAE